MLTHLFIHDYLLIHELSLDMPRGFIVLTGETGAGKSMILGAIDVLLGKPFPKDAARSVIEGIFSSEDIGGLIASLGEEYFEEGDDELLLRREISPRGRTRSYLNDHPLPQARLHELRESFLDMHGQRDNQILFRAERQLDFLDTFAGTRELAQQFRDVYRQRYDLNKKANSLNEQLEAHLKEQALLSYQLEEIERLGLREGEEASLETRLKKLENSELLRSKSQMLEEILSAGEISLSSLIGRARLLASELSVTDSDLDPIVLELKNIESQTKDLAAQIRDYGESIVMDERELESLRERCSVLWELKRKHGMTVDQIITRAGELKGLLVQGERLQAQITELRNSMDDLDHELIKIGSELSRKRKASAPALSKKIGERLRPLGFNKPRFNIAVESDAKIIPEAIGRAGADRVQFQIAVNPGSRLAGLSDVASGGESSRVLLAVKSVLAEKMRYPLSIYDEIDLGISGQIAERVGNELAHMGKRHQLMVISHLPQIASSADHHLFIEKKLTGTSAVTTARFLKEKERVTAVAALMAGKSVTKQLLASADELFQQRKNHKKVNTNG